MWRLEGVVEHVIGLAEKHPATMVALVENFTTSISKQALQILERLEDTLPEGNEALKEHATEVLKLSADLIKRYSNLADAPRDSETVLEDARNLVYLAKRTEQIDSLAWEKKPTAQRSKLVTLIV